MATTTTQVDTDLEVNSEMVSVTTTYYADEIWLSLTGSGFANTNYWIREIEMDSENTPCNITLTHLDKNEVLVVTTTITPQQIYSAFGMAIENCDTHCGGYAISDLDNSDACFADVILQYAIFNEVIFG